jgi:hypothetical protein
MYLEPPFLPRLFHLSHSDSLVSNERFELHDTIFVNSQEQPDDAAKEGDEEVPQKTIDETDSTLWVAAVVEVRAQNAWNVWVRIEWFYRPDELPGGRQPYHGKREVIKSPVQDIISAHTVAGHADVTHWEEMDDTKDADGIDGLFWRQTFDPYSGKLSVCPSSSACPEADEYCVGRAIALHLQETLQPRYYHVLVRQMQDLGTREVSD